MLAACHAPPADAVDGELCAPRGPQVGWFVERGADTGLDFSYHSIDFRGGAIAVGDFDGDRALDVIAGSRDGRLAAFRNLGGLRFAEVTADWGLPGVIAVSYLAHADLDGDGDLDLIVAGGRGASIYEMRDGRFALARLLGNVGPSEHVLPVDLDGDGVLDLYVSNRAVRDPERSRNQLYRGLGDLAYERFDAAAGAGSSGLSWTATAFDHDGDGDLDLHVANDTLALDFGDRYEDDSGEPRDCLYLSERGDAGLELRDRGAELGLTEPRSSMGGLLGDFDGDAALDLFITDFGQNDLYRVDDGAFTEITVELGLGAAHRDDLGCSARSGTECLLLSWGAARADFDLDGHDDLLVVNGPAVLSGEPPPPLVYRGSDAGYDEVAAGLGCFAGHGLVAADLDRDGDLDLVTSTSEGPLRLFENQSVAGGWLTVELRGTHAGSEGRGAVIELEREDGRRLVRTVGSGGVVHSALPVEAHFGLGAHAPRALTVTWPGGGRQRVEVGAANQHVVIVEPVAP